MQSDDLIYSNLMKIISPLLVKGKGESVTFLNWFLENIYRLDSVAADDAICDSQNDKGIDAIYVDNNNEEIHFFQCKVRQKANGTVGDVNPKTFVASVGQFDSKEKIDAILAGNANQGLKNLLSRLEISDLVGKGYRPVAVYVTNEKHDDDSISYEKVETRLIIYDRDRIAENFIDADQGVGVQGTFEFDLSYVDPLTMVIGSATDGAEVFVFPARALELVALGGIADTSLFTKNVRYSLGNTPVNKSIKKSIERKPDHKHFPLFHNGVILLCESATVADGKLKISNYSVVNGAQSITTFHGSKSKLTDDLRILVRVIALKDDELARKITEYSNNQNAIKPRDLRSGHTLMTRLQEEMSKFSDTYFFEIKRGEVAPKDRIVISNEESGRALLAIDLLEPWSCHQVYKIFDDKYAEIFGRKEVDAARVIHVIRLMRLIEKKIDGIEVKPLAHYALTRYFLASVLSRILRLSESSHAAMRNPSSLTGPEADAFYKKCEAIVGSLVIDLNYEVKAKGPTFDYKAELKSPKQVEELTDLLLKSYEKDVARGKAESFS
ncbi:AIPR family protein [Brevundimonas viscosa]|uniref:AIPR protein n=1 Tax=Brevundimonas viscosa TaxID=871741 RepID=A0A1I6PSX9_9CAUL|nr:AIPR family protein [Brevundimonas viscosa]SFS43322.1 AIPR protein [Brevundimonas viscosa]